ncbi:MAG: protein kinase [Myxococcota bacterium]
MSPISSEPSGRFAIEARVGGGASGDIFRALDRQTGAPVALKVLRHTASSIDKTRFEREVSVLADLRHPNIVTYVAHGTWPDGRSFLAMEWLEGEDLAKRQRRAPLGMRDSVEVIRRAAQALAAIHARGIVHRDLKLSNMFLVRGRGTAVKLIDFGVVKSQSDADFQTETGTILGTPHYMAPEQARGETVDPRADVYALGSVLFRLVTGRNVFETEHVIALLGRLVLEDPPRPAQLRFDIPEKLDVVIHRAIARRSEERYPHAGELARALARVGAVDNTPPQIERSGSQVRPRRPRSSETTATGTGESRPTRPGLRTRRVVACMLYDGGEAEAVGDGSDALAELVGEDVRIERLAGGQTVAVLGVTHSRGDEAMRAARAALQLRAQNPSSRAVVAVGHAVMAKSNLAGEALDRAATQLDRAQSGEIRLDGHATGALEMRFELARDAAGARLLREDPRDLAPRRVLGRITPTVGREREIVALQTRYHQLLRDAQPRATLVLGEAGVGKSRIRSELVQRLEVAPMPPEVLVVRGSADHGSGSISQFGRALRAHMGVKDGAAADAQVQLVKRHVRSRLPRSLHFLAAFIGEMVGVPFPDEADEPLRAARGNDQLMQSRIHMALEAFVRTIAGRIPQIVILEDAHHADDTTVELCGWLLNCPDIRFACYAFGQPELLAQRPELWKRARREDLTVAPLSASAADRLIQNLRPDCSEPVRRELVVRAAGNPFILEELVRCLRDGQDELPLTVQELVQRRLDQLAPEVREVLQAAAVFGDTFWSGGVGALLDRDDPLEALAVLEREDLIVVQPESRVVGQSEYLFRQTLVQDAAHTSLLEEDRGRLHLAAGGWLEASGSADLGLMAHHFELGGDRDRAASLYARATQQALANFGQMDSALFFAQRGLHCGADHGERAQLLLTQAQVYHRMGRLDDSIAAAREAVTHVPIASDMWVEGQRLLAAGLIEAGHPADGETLLQRALADDDEGTSGQEKPPEGRRRAALARHQRATLAAARVRGLMALGRGADALAAAQAAVEDAKAAGRKGRAPMLRALDAKVFALMTLIRPAAAIEAATELIAAADEVGDLHLASRGRINCASTLNYVGQHERAQTLCDQAAKDVRSFGLRMLEASWAHNLGMARARRGALDEGIDLQHQAIAVADECGGRRLATNARVYLVMLLTGRGAPGDLREALDVALHLNATPDAAGAPTSAHAAMGPLAVALAQLARRDFAAARAAIEPVLPLLETTPMEEFDEPIRRVYVEALLGAGDTHSADVALVTAQKIIEARGAALGDDALATSYQRHNVDVARLLELAGRRRRTE